GRWEPDPAGDIDRWAAPETGADYLVAVDIGGRTDSADWSVAAVMRTDTALPEVVAQWRGHVDHDILADIAARLATYYGEALLAVESNTLESSGDGYGAYILERLAATYPRLYMRGGGADGPLRPGFHTNRRTKEQVVSGLIRAVRLGEYIERDHRACDELLTYRTTPEGRYQAMAGCHDDILMTRAIALHLLPAAAPTAPLRPYLDSRRW
ncbi:MAG: hypothetical protein NC406_08650, partial [Bacteroides sp.]|nr:hypothetical protein [Bacteroides sp.]